MRIFTIRLWLALPALFLALFALCSQAQGAQDRTAFDQSRLKLSILLPAGATATRREFPTYDEVVIALPDFLETLQCVSGLHQDLIKATYYDKFKEYAENLSKLKALVETTVDLEAANYHQYMIKAEFHPELKEIREKMETITSDIQKTARYTANDLGLEFEKKLKYEHSPQYGHHLRLSRNVGSIYFTK